MKNKKKKKIVKVESVFRQNEENKKVKLKKKKKKKKKSNWRNPRIRITKPKRSGFVRHVRQALNENSDQAKPRYLINKTRLSRWRACWHFNQKNGQELPNI
jgi:hypothetical protein